MNKFIDRSYARFAFLASAALVATGLSAATHYVDSSATGSNNGSSWANAWTTLSTVSASAGDVIYISGGGTGSTQTYSMSSYWNPPSGSSGNRITYQIGQDAAHNGTAIFNYVGTNSNGNPWLSGPTNITVSGDAGDGRMHFKLMGYTQGVTNVSNVRVTYIDASGMPALLAFMSIGGQTGIELDNCAITISDLTADHAVYAKFGGSTWDANKIHDCTIRIPRLAGGTGADGLQCTGVGYSIYNNTIIGYLAAYLGGQHQDGWQSTGSDSYVKIYANTFVDIANYAVYGDAYFGGFTNVLIYNNLAVVSDPTIAAATPGGFIVGVDGGYNGTAPCTFTNVVIANNAVVDYHTNQSAIALNNITGFSAAYNQCYIVNNVLVNSGSLGTTGNSTTTIANNVSISKSSAASNFNLYSEFGALNNNLHLKTTASSLVATGNNLSSYFTVDKDGASRASSGNWDVGAYISGSSGTTSPPSNAKITIATQ